MWETIGVGLLSLWSAVAAADVHGIAHVVDGDTFRVAGETVRLHGIDAPEQGQTCQTEHGVEWACGAWVSDMVRTGFDGKYVRCEELDQDRYGRMVARCTHDGEDIGDTLVSSGLAFAFRKYSRDYDLAETGADVNDRGLHGFRVQSPAQFRRTRTKGRIPPDPACRIKGNISANGRIFHVPGQRDYERTGISLVRGEIWFCSEQDALSAGWRKARR